MLKGRSLLITGGTGSFGRAMVSKLLETNELRRLVVFSRDELKQSEMQERHPMSAHGDLRYFIGDVRDQERLYDALRGIDVVIHAAALKQVPTAEYNPFEAVQTNVLGAQNLIRAAIRQGVQQVVALSTDKAANPINLYGATKLCADKLFVAGNAMAGKDGPVFSVVRYGNVFGSRGSVVPLFLRKRRDGVLPVTDERMTRFSLTLEAGVEFVLACLQWMRGGEIFVPKLPSYRILDVAKAIAPEARIEITGIRPGEKLHEVLVPSDESWHTVEHADRFIIHPSGWSPGPQGTELGDGRVCTPGFAYSSDTNDQWLSVEQLTELVRGFAET